MAQRRYGSLFRVWAEWAAGIVANITLTPKRWEDMYGEVLQVRRYSLDAPDEATFTHAERAPGVPIEGDKGNSA